MSVTEHIASLGLRLFAADVDGTLTDGGMYYTEAGEAMKRFDTRDAAGMARLGRRGLAVAIVTSEDSPIVLARARKLKIEHVYVGVADKERLMEELLAKLGLSWQQLAYVGDDLNDLAVIRRAGFSACPCDAAPEIARQVSYVCHRGGGRGAVREVCDLIERAIIGVG
jgi:YrbI family 3-deoxy-D-manno-octulosonate 8-phosphate phosphatase